MEIAYVLVSIAIGAIISIWEYRHSRSSSDEVHATSANGWEAFWQAFGFSTRGVKGLVLRWIFIVLISVIIASFVVGSVRDGLLAYRLRKDGQIAFAKVTREALGEGDPSSCVFEVHGRKYFGRGAGSLKEGQYIEISYLEEDPKRNRPARSLREDMIKGIGVGGFAMFIASVAVVDAIRSRRRRKSSKRDE